MGGVEARRAVAGLTALVAAAALALQLVLLVERMTGEGASVGAAIWRFLGFFTILTNCAVAIVAGAMTAWPRRPLAGARARLATASAILFVGLVYSVALRATWAPTGWQAVADHGLHDVTPPLFLIAWAIGEHGGLDWREAGWAAVGPFVYCLYALARGAYDGWYPYWFLDPRALTGTQLAANVMLLLVALSIVALALVAVDKQLARRRPRAELG